MIPDTVMYQALLTIHFIGLAFGLGGAFISDAAFAKSIRKADRVSVETVNWMRTFSAVIWTGIGLLAVSGGGLFLLDPQKYIGSSAFAAKMVFVFILIVNGLFLNFYTTARLTTFNFSEKYTTRGAAWRARKLSFLFGAISAVTWYSVLFIAMFKNFLDLPFAMYLLIYFALLSGAICGSLVLEKLLFTHYQHQKLPEDINKVPLSVLSTYPASKLAELAQKQKAARENPTPVPEPVTVPAPASTEAPGAAPGQPQQQA